MYSHILLPQQINSTKMNTIAFKKIMFFLIFFSSIALWSQDRGRISGKITLNNNTAAENISVTLKGTSYSAVSNQYGQYEIKNVKPGTYVLRASAVGIAAIEDNVTVVSSTTITKNFTLSESPEQLNEVVIQEKKNKYKTGKISSSLRLNTPVLEIPQNIQVVSNQTLKDQQIISMSDGVIRNVSGAVRLEHWGDMYTNITMRGSQIQAFRNGFNVVSSFWGPLTEDMSFVDHIEFVKGPAGFMLANGDPSGLYNVVTKKPTGETKGEVSVMAGSYDFYRASADLDGKLTKDGKLLYRINLAAQNKGSHRPYEHNDRYVIAPVISYQADDKTKITAEYNYQRANMTEVGSFYVFGPESRGYASTPRNLTLTQPGLPDTKMNDHSAYLMLEHQINSDWKITAQTSYFKYLQKGYSSWPSAVGPLKNKEGETLLKEGELIRNVGIWDAESTMYLGQFFVNGKFMTGAVSHKILGGVDLGNKEYMADWGQSHDLDTFDKPFNIYAPNYGPPANGFPDFDRDTPLKERAGGIITSKYAAGYFQDELGFFENRLRVTVAARYTYAEQANYGGPALIDNHISPRAGISYSIDQNTAVYGLYDQAFIQQSGKLRDGGDVKPITGNNTEVGIKRDWFGGSWTTTLSAYRILKKNELTADPNSPPLSGLSIVFGEKRAQGIEFDVRGKIIDGLNVIANYAFTESIVNEVAPGVTNIKKGDIVPGYSKHTANAWVNYTIQDGRLKGLGASAGFTYLADRATDNWGAGNEKLPDYFKLDGGLSYETGAVKFTANVFNILDKYLFTGSAYSFGDVKSYYWQSEPPRTFRVGMSYKF
jgi:iron complex outermembrane receptor protein